MSLITATKDEREYIDLLKSHFKIINQNIPTNTTQMNTLLTSINTKKKIVDASNVELTTNMMTILKTTWT